MEVLTAAGERALAQGDTDVAVDLLRRALDEAPATPELLLALGAARGTARTARAPTRTWPRRRAPRTRRSPRARRRPARACSSSPAAPVAPPRCCARASHAPATSRTPSVLEAALGSPRVAGHADLAAELEEDLLDALIYDPDLAEERRQLLFGAEPRPAVLAFRAFDRAAAGAPADEVRALALQALAGGALLAGNGIERPALQYAIEALMAVEAADEAKAALDQVAEAARRAGSRVGAGVVALLRTRWEHEFGDLEAAADAARCALEIQSVAAAQRAVDAGPRRARRRALRRGGHRRRRAGAGGRAYARARHPDLRLPRAAGADPARPRPRRRGARGRRARRSRSSGAAAGCRRSASTRGRRSSPRWPRRVTSRRRCGPPTRLWPSRASAGWPRASRGC